MFRDRVRLDTGTLSPSSSETNPAEPHLTNISNLSGHEVLPKGAKDQAYPTCKMRHPERPKNARLMVAGDRSWQLDLI